MNLVNELKGYFLVMKLSNLKKIIKKAGLVGHWIKIDQEGSIISYMDYENKLYPQTRDDNNE